MLKRDFQIYKIFLTFTFYTFFINYSFKYSPFKTRFSFTMNIFSLKNKSKKSSTLDYRGRLKYRKSIFQMIEFVTG